MAILKNNEPDELQGEEKVRQDLKESLKLLKAGLVYLENETFYKLYAELDL